MSACAKIVKLPILLIFTMTHSLSINSQIDIYFCANVPTQLLDGVGCGELKSVFIATNNGNGIGEVVAKLVDEIDCC